MKFLDWLHIRTGVPIDKDGYYGPQCTDLVNDYLVEIWATRGLGGNAVDFQHGVMPNWIWVENRPDNAPPTGAVVVWGGPNGSVGTSSNGHTAVALLADRMSMITFDQNWPPGHAPQQVRHSYGAVVGWWAPPIDVLGR